MAANRINMCYFDARKNAFNKECVIYVINRLLGAEIVTEANFDNAKIKSRRPAPGATYEYFLIVGGAEYPIPLFSGTQYGNSSGGHINARRAALPAEFNDAHVELVKAIMRRGAWGGEGYLYQLLGNPGNYEPDPRFPGKVEVLMRNLENLEQEQAMRAAAAAAGGGAAGGGGGGPGYMNALQAARNEAMGEARSAYIRELEGARAAGASAGHDSYMTALAAARAESGGGGGGAGANGYMRALEAARANASSSARIAYGNNLNAARREVREAAMEEYLRDLAAARKEAGAGGAGSKKYGGKRHKTSKRRSTRRKSKH